MTETKILRYDRTIKQKKPDLSTVAKEKRNWTDICSTTINISGTALLVIFLAVVWFYFAAMITGNDGLYGPWSLLTHPNYGNAAILFTAMVALVLLLNLKMKFVSWKPARNLVLVVSILVGIYIVAVSIWPQLKPRELLANIPKVLAAETQTSAPPVKPNLTNHKIYPPGTYTFSLKAGEMTDHWIMFPASRKNNYLFKSDDWKFQVLYDDGEVIDAWEDGSWPDKIRVKCKIIAVTDQPGVELTLQ